MSDDKALPKHLYHGTNSDHLQDILKFGLRPREITGNSQWEHTVESRSDAVYLTVAYPLHFAANAQGEGDPIIVEIDSALLDKHNLIADEDALALALKIPEVTGMSALERAAYFRTRSHAYPASVSLTALGNCAYLGDVPREAITRIIRITASGAARFILGGFDPVIAPLNYKIFGEQYKQSVRWLFGDEEVCELNERLDRESIQPVSLELSDTAKVAN